MSYVSNGSSGQTYVPSSVSSRGGYVSAGGKQTYVTAGGVYKPNGQGGQMYVPKGGSKK